MNVSGILVVVPVVELSRAVEALDALPGVDVHHTDPSTGRLVVTLEAPSIEAEVEGLKRIQALPMVTLAEMVHHHVAELDESDGIDFENDHGRSVPISLED